MIISKLYKYAAAVLAFLAGIAAVYFKGRGAGKAAEQAKASKQNEVAITDAVKKLETKADVQTEVDKLPDGAAAERLRNGWSRD